MKWFHHFLLLVLLAVVGVAAVEEFRSKLRADDALLTDEPQVLQGGRGGVVSDSAGVIDPQSPRDQLLEQLKAKVGLMSDEEIEHALSATVAEVRSLQAKKHLDQTAETLRFITKKFDGTPAAAIAADMLKSYRGQAAATSTLDSNLPESFIRQMLSLMTERESLIEKFGAKHPDVVALDSKIATTRALLEERALVSPATDPDPM